MDQEAGVTLSKSDLQARRLLDLTMTLSASALPISSSQIHELHYSGTSDETFRRLFNRDRKRLSVCGITISRTNRQPDEALWTIDEKKSFVHDSTISPRESIILDLICSQLAADPSFPLASDLETALAKIDRAFDRKTPVHLFGTQEKRGRLITALEGAFLEQHPVDIQYVTSQGERVERRICIFGIFSYRGHSYFVGPSLDKDGSPIDGSVRSYRSDRFSSAREYSGITYEIPPDFDVHDYVLLPFQLGPALYDAFFTIPTNVLDDVLRELSGRGAVMVRNGLSVVRLSVSDEVSAAKWAISRGVIPTEPASLVRSWRGILLETINNV